MLSSIHMTNPEQPETQSTPERKTSFPAVGDLVETTHFPLGVVISTHFPEWIDAAAISVDADDYKRISLPGTINMSDVLSIKGSWDIDDITGAWENTWKHMRMELSEEQRHKFRSELLAGIALNQEQRPADQ